MTLKEACEKRFRGQITPATLRAEAGRGKLRITRIGRRDFVTEADLQEMIELCRLPVRTSSSPRSQPEDPNRGAHARAALKRVVRDLKKGKPRV